MSDKKDHADVKIHPPVLTLIFLLLAYFGKKIIPLPFAVPNWLQTFGFIMVVAGFLLAVAALREFRKVKTTVNPHGSVTTIISSGIFGFTRNPIYVGLISIALGFPLYFNTYWGVILTPILILCFNKLVIEHEEAYLEEKFGETYTSYKSRVRRWL